MKEIKTLKQEDVAEYLEYRDGHLWWIKSPGRRKGHQGEFMKANFNE